MGKHVPAHRDPEAGFALLFIFCLAAIVGILLYSATPRAAFEAERDREQLLIDRGQQYQRAIRVFYRTLHRYPAKIEELENTGNQRFLRRRYVDPFTGSADWRLIHVGPGGALTDSVNTKKKTDGQGGSVNNFITELQPLGSTDVGATGANVALRRRASDQAGAPGTNPLAGGPPATDGSVDPNAPAQTPQPSGAQAIALQLGVADAINAGNSPQAGAQPPGAPQQPPNGYPNPTGNYAGIPVGAVPPGPAGAQIPGVAPSPGTPGAPGNNAAASLIQNLLTRPRPGGYPGSPEAQDANAAANAASGGAFSPGLTPGVTPNAVTGNLAPGIGTPVNGPQGPVIGAGIAGVASKDEHEGIKVYNDKTKHNEWEFIYDYGKEAGAALNAGQQQKPAPPVKP